METYRYHDRGLHQPPLVTDEQLKGTTDEGAVPRASVPTCGTKRRGGVWTGCTIK